MFQESFYLSYFAKEDGIYMKNHSERCENLNTVRRNRYYEIKLKLSNEEISEDINSYIKNILTLFSKFIIAYKDPDPSKNPFTKIIIAGLGPSQSEIKRGIRKTMKQIKKDCLIKFSIFSSLSNCIKNTFEKCIDCEETPYTFFSNL
jgi:hypothetical protein